MHTIYTFHCYDCDLDFIDEVDDFECPECGTQLEGDKIDIDLNDLADLD